MRDLALTYGNAIIPKDTLLYRSYGDRTFRDCMFFATKLYCAKSFGDIIQIWKTTKDIKVLFLVGYLTSESYSISSLPQLYCDIFPLEKDAGFDDLDIKLPDLGRRDKLAATLFSSYKVSGWLTSIEGRAQLEVCLFNTEANSRQIQLVDECDRKHETYFKDSLHRFEITPTETFLSKTESELNKRAPIFSDEPNHYKRYRNMILEWVRIECENGMPKLHAEHYFYNLRLKLEI